MYSSNNLPWRKINNFLIDVGETKEPKKFCMQVINKIQRLIPYDQARIYFLKNTGQIDGEVLVDVDESWGCGTSYPVGQNVHISKRDFMTSYGVCPS